ncbi:hypothetical protein [Ruania alba]|uniref:Gram-positive cocci surface proteins LPxTG domain-containing protein n=1 Tax=Ruania alba TaxID=648782 RepID=A0A1H5M826_9MICO|nr:hypothetical protein [Ruania alba]SEE85320.1 hypothetical protein SAMN04488554_3200 [Ruania alba]
MRHARTYPGKVSRRPAGVALGTVMAAILAMTVGASAGWAESAPPDDADTAITAEAQNAAEAAEAVTETATTESTDEAGEEAADQAQESVTPLPTEESDESEESGGAEESTTPADSEESESTGEDAEQSHEAEESHEAVAAESEQSTEVEGGEGAEEADESEESTDEASAEDGTADEGAEQDVAVASAEESVQLTERDVEVIQDVGGGAATECADIGFDFGVKLDTGAAGSYTYYGSGPWEPDGIDIALSVTIADSHTFSFMADPAVGAILVKAGQGSQQLAGGTAGFREIGGQQAISHLTFCYNEPEEELTVTQTLETTFDREHFWSIDKWADPESLTLYPFAEAGPTSGTIDWTVDVGYEGHEDSGHVVSGTISIENTGDTTAAFDGTHVLETSEGNILPDLDCVPPVPILDPGGTFTCTYSHPVDSAVSGQSVLEIVTSENSYAADPAPITWGDPDSEVNATIDVTDVSDLNGLVNESFTAPNGGTITYDWDFAWSEFGLDACGAYSYDNAATITQTEQSADESVTVEVVCLETTPVVPTLTPGICTDGVLVHPTLALAETDGIEYAVDSEGPYAGGQTVGIMASLTEGYVWGEVGSEWTIVDDLTVTTDVTLEEVPCIPTLPEPPSVDDGDCEDGAGVPPSLTLGETAGITYSVDPSEPYEPGQTVTVTATLAEGYSWGEPAAMTLAPAAATAGGRSVPARVPTEHAVSDTEAQPVGWPEEWTYVSPTEATFEVTFEDPECPQTQPPQVAASPQLPSTGTPSLDLAALTLATLAGGLLLASVARRRRTTIG